MGSETPPARGSRSSEAQLSAALAAIGAWTIAVPFLGDALGLGVNVASRVEVVDHVIPGLVVTLGGSYLARLTRHRPLAGVVSALAASSMCFLAGVWVLATHVPLVADATARQVMWGAALWHSLTALPIVGLAAWCVLRSTGDPGGSVRSTRPR